MDIHLHFSTIFWSFLLIYCCSCAKYNRPTRERITAGCPFGYLHYQSACYKVSGDFASFAAAEAQCAADGGFLAVPDDQAAQEHLVKLASARPGSYWIGIRKDDNSQWIKSGLTKAALRFTSWAPGVSPNSSPGENCAIMLFTFKYNWVPTGCSFSIRYICQVNIGSKTKEETRCAAKLLKEKHNVDIKGLSKAYQVGFNVNVSCDRGSVTATTRGKGTLASCKTPGWTLDDPCVVACELPKDLPSNALVAKDDEHVFIAGDTLKLSCEEGYQIVGTQNSWRCLDNGTWAEEPFKCVLLQEQAKCLGTPEHIENLVVPEGYPVSIRCIPHFRIEPRSVKPIQQSDGPQTIWMKELALITPGDNISIDPSDDSLVIDSMAADYEGLYTCVAPTESRDNFILRSVRVLLKRKCCLPVFDVVPEDSEISDSGYTILRCHSNDSTVEWLRDDGTLVVNSNEDQDEEDWDAKVLGNGALLVRAAGAFECVAKMNKQDDCENRKKVQVGFAGTARNVPVNVCGRPKVRSKKNSDDTLRGKVVGGTEVVPGSHPWMSLIEGEWRSQVSSTSRIRVFCGGSLVNDLHVVTAAHCFEAISHLLDRSEDLEKLKVKLGKHDRVITEPYEITRTARSVTVHPAFDKNTFDNDVAVIKLNSAVSFTAQVLPICLPSKGFLANFMSSTKGPSGLVAGWGQLQEEGARPLELREVRLPLADERTCRRSTNETITGNMFCAGYELETNDACKGDSGGPFEVESQGVVYLAGIVSWGEGCGRPRTYGFYTKVERVEQFVAAVLERRESAVATKVSPASKVRW